MTNYNHIRTTKNFNSVINYLPSCCPKPITPFCAEHKLRYFFNRCLVYKKKQTNNNNSKNNLFRNYDSPMDFHKSTKSASSHANATLMHHGACVNVLFYIKKIISDFIKKFRIYVSRMNKSLVWNNIKVSEENLWLN